MNKKQLDEVFDALCANGLSSSVSSFLTTLLERIDEVERRVNELVGDGR